jgi:hypothetical protein
MALNDTTSGSKSPVRTIASPRMLRGLALFKGIESPKNKVEYVASSNGSSFDNEDIENFECREEIECFEPMIFNNNTNSPPLLKKFLSAPDQHSPVPQPKSSKLTNFNNNEGYLSKLSTIVDNSTS